MPKHAQISRTVRLPLLGAMYLTAETGGLVAFSSSIPENAPESMPESTHESTDGRREPDTAETAACEALIRQAEAELLEYLEGKRTAFTVPLAPKGTAFQHKVWQELLRIPYGKTSTYGEVAIRIGGLHLARAAGHAAASNKLPLFIPCHRLLGKGGRIGGFSLFCETIGGPKLKECLLALENGLPYLQ